MAAIIFDFDGTIADTFDYVFDYLAAESGQAAYTPQQRQEFRNMSMVAIARRLGHPWWRMPRLLLRGRKLMARVIKDTSLFKGMREVIEKLHAEGHELFIVSSNNVHNIHAFLHHHNLHTYFLEIYGGIGIFGKAPALRRLMRDQKLEVKDCIYIGDELRDVEAAQSLKMRVVAVGWGFAKHEDLINIKPTKLVDSPTELLDQLQQI